MRSIPIYQAALVLLLRLLLLAVTADVGYSQLVLADYSFVERELSILLSFITSRKTLRQQVIVVVVVVVVVGVI